MSSSSRNAAPGAVPLGALIYETKIPPPNMQRVWRAMFGIFAIIAFTLIVYYVFRPAVVAIPLGISFVATLPITERKIVGGFVCLVTGIAILAVFVLYLLPLDQSYPGIAILFSIIAGIPGIAGLFFGGLFLWQYYADSRLHLALYQQGVVLDLPNSHSVHTWNDLASIKSGISRKLYRFEIIPRHGPHFVLTDRFSNGIMIGDAILRLFTNARFPACQQALKMGQTLPFGPISLSQAGISRGNHLIPWQDLDISRNDALGFTLISRKTGRQWNFPALAVPNRPLIVALSMAIRSP